MLEKKLTELKQMGGKDSVKSSETTMTEIAKEYLEQVSGGAQAVALASGHDMYSRNYPDPNPYWRSITTL